MFIKKESKTDSFKSFITAISSVIYYYYNYNYPKQTTNRNFNFNFNFIPMLLLLLPLIVLSLSNTCSCSSLPAEDINTNTVVQVKLNSGIEIATTTANTLIKSTIVEADNKKVIINKKKKIDENFKKIIEYDCPNNDLAGLSLFFGIPCKTNSECNFLGSDQKCCKNICRRGIPALPKEPKHRAVLGLDRMCPKEPVPEILPVTSCVTDIDCEQERRICCPDKDLKLYCRTAAPVWSQLPFPRAHEPLMSLMEYMQCQKAPPQLLDLFSQPCNRTLDCLPNLCCQEGPNKFCRPAKKSVLSLFAQATQRFTRG